jgi:hypothetical protein
MTLKEAQQKADLATLEPTTIEEEGQDITNLMQEKEQQPNLPVQPVPAPVPTKEIQDGKSKLVEEPHIDGKEIDLAFAKEVFDKTKTEQQEFEAANQESKVIGPDPSTRPARQ